MTCEPKPTRLEGGTGHRLRQRHLHGDVCRDLRVATVPRRAADPMKEGVEQRKRDRNTKDLAADLLQRAEEARRRWRERNYYP